MKIKNLTIAAMILGVGIVVAPSCKKKGCMDPTALNYNAEAEKEDEDNPCVYDIVDPADSSTVVVSSNITSNTTWTNDKTWVLGGRIAVQSGATLTIEAGTVIKGEAGSGTNATALIVAKGAKIMAEGTATAPIIFTSVADEITPEDVANGNFVSPNMDESINGLWGGLIVLGNAKISVSSGTSAQIEGIPTSDPNGEYGGSDDADNSGVLKYISIRHGGSNIGAGNEINGLTLGGVGSGTVIQNIEVVANQDDGIEWFGGSVSVSDVVIWNVGDDGLDTDQGWSGTCSNFFVVTCTNSALELDGPEGASLGNGNHTFTNGIIHSGLVSDDIIDFDDNTNVTINDVYFDQIEDTVEITGYAGGAANDVSISNWEHTLSNGVGEDAVFVDIPTSELTAVSQGANTVGPSASSFAWTWAQSAGKL